MIRYYHAGQEDMHLPFRPLLIYRFITIYILQLSVSVRMVAIIASFSFVL